MKNKAIILLAFILLWSFVFVTPKVSLAQNFTGVYGMDQDMVEDDINEDDYDESLDPLLQDLNQDVLPASNLDQLYYQGDLAQYTLGKEDVIEIKVLRHPEVSGTYIVNSEGSIQYEFVGDINIEGLKKDELKDLLIGRLSTYILNPDVQIKIVGYNSKIIYVIGEVARPGKIIMQGDSITVREALIQAGLPLLTGKLSKARLITPSETGHADSKKVNVHKLLYKGDLRENLVMGPGDTLYIPATAMTKTMRAIQPVAAPISAGRAVTTGY